MLTWQLTQMGSQYFYTVSVCHTPGVIYIWLTHRSWHTTCNSGVSRNIRSHWHFKYCQLIQKLIFKTTDILTFCTKQYQLGVFIIVPTDGLSWETTQKYIDKQFSWVHKRANNKPQQSKAQKNLSFDLDLEAEWCIYASVIKPSSVQIMTCHLLGVKPLSEPMME